MGELKETPGGLNIHRWGPSSGALPWWVGGDPPCVGTPVFFVVVGVGRQLPIQLLTGRRCTNWSRGLPRTGPGGGVGFQPPRQRPSRLDCEPAALE